MGNSNVPTNNSTNPQVQPAPAPAARTWANVAKILTKGYQLAYVPPLMEDGEVIVNITPEVVADENPCWLECIVGHYIGKKVPFKLTEEAVKKSWGDQVVDVKLHENGFYFFQVPNAEFRRNIIDSGSVSIFSSTMLLQQWHSKMKLKKGSFDSLPVWVRLRDIPFSLWSPAGIGRIASAIGNPLYVDRQTELMTQISYARVCVEIKAITPRVEAVKFRWDDEVNVINIEYEWKPLVCSSCGDFARIAQHAPEDEVALNQGEMELSSAGLNPAGVIARIGSDLDQSKDIEGGQNQTPATYPIEQIDQQDEDPSQSSQSCTEGSSESGILLEKTTVAEDLLEMEPASVSPPNTRSRTMASSATDETSKSSHGTTPTSACPVKVPNLSSSKKSKRRRTRKYQRLSACDTPWIVAGDFNAIRDPNDRVGSTTPWIPAFDEFGDCLNQTGLEDLRYVGCRYTWSHSSGVNRKLRKIDRVLINDLWNQHFSFSEATFLAPGISDHSPMVIKILPTQNSKKSFKFFNFWTTHPKFLDIVAETWNTHQDEE
ncbi:uncharacterized protein LOC115693581 [Syzygium oleosum]|uniref:uncharacterized protein LOC115693581 n=1 Tax=Syzygium oleosum TaxID=219896 RepID=UPI0024BBCEAD|nr:uncharacterized protein LOC115693581 [Syzygium oleosum]